jgi:hypothetical protein
VEVDDVAALGADRSALDFAAAYGNLATQVQASQRILAELQGQAIDQTLADRSRLTELQASLTALQAAVRLLFAPEFASEFAPEFAPEFEKPPRLAAIDIEIRKQLRLIQIDGQFLNTARQPATLTDRLDSIRGHLELLDRYAQGALLLLLPPELQPPAPRSPDPRSPDPQSPDPH